MLVSDCENDLGIGILLVKLHTISRPRDIHESCDVQSLDVG